MLKDILQTLYRRDIGRLRDEIAAYKDESNLWRVDGDVTNSAGNLALHLVGNLKTYFGAELAETGYVRDRPLEFADKNVSRNVLLEGIEESLTIVETTLARLSDADFAAEYPQVVFDAPMTTGYFLVHLATHLSYHLGQINYHRRVFDV